MNSPRQWKKEVQLGELYVLIHCQPLSSSMVLGLWALAKRQEREQGPSWPEQKDAPQHKGPGPEHQDWN